MKYSLINHDTFSNITVVHDGELYTASNDHPAFEKIVSGAIAGDESIVTLFNPEKAVAESFNKVSERVSLRSGKVYLDNELVDGSLTDQIVRFHTEGQDFTALVKFLENIANNPSSHSRTQLYDWLRDRDFTIDSDGHIIGYKGVQTGTDNDGNTTYSSISHGDAIVDGKEYSGAIPNYVGAVVEMPRSAVTWNPNIACNTGLHAGTWNYAHGFARGATLTVSINPRDVVSVPHDSNSEKIRVCRYTVLEVVDSPYGASYHDTTPAEESTDDAIDYDTENDEDTVVTDPASDEAPKSGFFDDSKESVSNSEDEDEEDSDLDPAWDDPYAYAYDEDDEDEDEDEDNDLDEEQTVDPSTPKGLNFGRWGTN